MSSILELNKISKTYKKGGASIPVLLPLNLKVEDEEFVCIIGPNGCGKSTLLKIIAGIIEPSTGEMKKSTGSSYLPQQPSLLPWRTVKQNLDLPKDIQRNARSMSQNDILQHLKDFELPEFADMYPHTLSGGMQQKVALLRTVLINQSLLLLDEPFASLDALTRIELQEWLLNLRRLSHANVICITHDIHEAINLADTIYVMSKRPGRFIKRLSVNRDATKKRAKNRAELESTLLKLLIR